MGAIFAVPLVHAPPEQLPGIKIALDARAERSLAAVWNQYAPTSATRFPPTFSLLIGAERAGLPNEILQAADETACIPIATESLNAAMAATIALYELTRMAPAR
jgi:TrmH family RNA methyltransferase